MIKDLFEKKNVIYSFEIFPPKISTTEEKFDEMLRNLTNMSPDFVSVTFGQMGSSADSTTCQIAKKILTEFNTKSVAHLTCLNHSEKEVKSMIDKLKANNIKNIMAIRGDYSDQRPPKNDFCHGRDLVEYINNNYENDFHVMAGCYPDMHEESKSMEEDIIFLKDKVSSGTNHLITQVFFDNNLFYDFVEKTKAANIDAKIQVGIMPPTNINSLKRIADVSNVKIPKKLEKLINKFQYNKEAMVDCGVYFATMQILELLSNGVDGIHLFTMNNPKVTERVHNNVASAIAYLNDKEE